VHSLCIDQIPFLTPVMETSQCTLSLQASEAVTNVVTALCV